ncbi:MAG: hypothetical protein ACFBSE_25620 [Prochloraceae cyanobacterium]
MTEEEIYYIDFSVFPFMDGEEEDNDPYNEAIYQGSSVEDSIYSENDYLAGEIIKQESGMVCLASKYMLIADIDCGDKIDWHLSILKQWVVENGGSFRIYKTKNGMRYLQTDVMYQGVNNSAIETLTALGSDPNYINLSRKGGRFMARLSPKLSSEDIGEYFESVVCEDPKIAVCHFIDTIGDGSISEILFNAVNYHDEQTSSEYKNLELY